MTVRHPRTPAASIPAALVGALLLGLTGCTGASSSGPSSSTDGSSSTSGARTGDERASTTRGADPSACSQAPVAGRTDLTSSGNRVLSGSIDLASTVPIDIQLDAEPEYVVPTGSSGSWYVTLTDGQAVVVDADGGVEPQGPLDPAVAAFDGPPVVTLGPGGEIQVGTDGDRHELFTDPLPDTRVVQRGSLAAALVGPTRRYPHGALGDPVEATAVEVVDLCTQERTRLEIPDSLVIEGLSPILSDLDSDGQTDVLVTLSNADVGALLAAYRLDGSLLAQSSPLGTGNRWRNQMAVAETGPDGDTEIVDVRVPHLSGVVEFFELRGEELVLTAEKGLFTSHVNGSRNLDMAVVLDATDDGRPDVVVLTQTRDEMTVLTHAADGAKVVDAVDLGGTAVTNIGAQDLRGQVALAVGTSSGRLLLWGPAQPTAEHGGDRNRPTEPSG